MADAMSTEGRAGETNLKNVQDAGAVILIGVDFGSNAKWCGARVLELQIRSSTAHISKFYGGMERCLALG